MHQTVAIIHVTCLYLIKGRRRPLIRRASNQSGGLLWHPKIIRNDEALSDIPSPVDQSGIASISLSVVHRSPATMDGQYWKYRKECDEEFGSYICFVHEGSFELNNSSV